LTLNIYKPGASATFSTTASILGVLVDVPGLVLTIHGPGGEFLTPSIVHDSTGKYHADVVIPLTGRPGTWSYRWYAAGAGPSTSGLGEAQFVVQALLS
jgi:hypothetical protein